MYSGVQYIILHGRAIAKMKFTILRIDKRIVTGQLDDGTIIDVARRWFTEDIEEGDTIEFSVEKNTNVADL